MSNRKVREEIEKKTNTKVYEAYKKQESFITNYQICKAYFHDLSCGVLCLVEKILKEKYNLPWQEKFIRRAVLEARGKNNPTISIPQFNFEETTHNILSKYVKRNFSTIVIDQRGGNRDYPFMLRDIIEKNS